MKTQSEMSRDLYFEHLTRAVDIEKLCLPKMVETDLLYKIEARKRRENASYENMDAFIKTTINDAVKCAKFIVKEFPFATRNPDDLRTLRMKVAKPLSHFILMQDEELRKLSQNLACQNIKLIGSVKLAANEDEESEGGRTYLDALASAYVLMRKNLRGYHLIAPMEGKKRFKTEDLEVSIRKMICDEWILRQLLSLRTYYIEYCQVALGRVGKGKHQSTMISDISYKNWTAAQRKAMAFIKSMCLVNEETGERYDLEEVVKRTTSNPKNRHTEMMVQARGFEDLAVSREYIGLFFTWTLPSKYHRNSDKWDGSSIKKGARRLMYLWGVVRATLQKAKLDYFGFRVSEPHKDGCCHAHYFMFCHPENADALIEVMQHYATQEDRAELGGDITPRFTVKKADPRQGGATAYIAKYIAKNITGNFLPESDAELNAFKARAWSSTWRIKQFQSFGGVAVTKWRTVRRAKKIDVEFDDECLEMFNHADKSRWAKFCETAGKAKLVIEKSINRYGETRRKVLGFSWLCKTILTTNGNFKLMSKSDLARADEALKSSGATSWSTENNCNQPRGEVVKKENNNQSCRFTKFLRPDFLSQVSDDEYARQLFNNLD
ncbi:replication endonuclease [Moritella sp.]|uniref:replication endonuclease n=1 Tax=Moritella sp. TaxID=78556 RepID=UPI001DFE1189|nr:replication endonuclease [Moritella sp.]MCJ8350741.1 replication endonuclease [Moritella sp.]NQZ42025.1 replication endonuclease [Moritella sp.]